MSGPYDDMLHLPHHVSERRARMSPLDRAAQFSPFAALTGYEAVVAEAARLTQKRIELDVDAKAELDDRLYLLSQSLDAEPQVCVTYFVPDERKDGGAYITAEGRVRRLNRQEKWLLLSDGTRVFFEDILTLSSDLFLVLE